jgi:hypothetical protein
MTTMAALALTLLAQAQEEQQEILKSFRKGIGNAPCGMWLPAVKPVTVTPIIAKPSMPVDC